MIRFLSIVFTLLLYTAYKAAQLAPAHSVLAAALTVPFFFLMLGWLFLYRSNEKFYDVSWFQAFAWIGSLLLGLWGTFVLFSFPFDVTRLAGWIFTRRNLLPEQLPLILLGLSFATAVIGFIQARLGPKVVSVTAPITALAPSLEGFKIAQISDLHIGLTLRDEYVRKIVQKTNALDPDLIVLTGDVADAHPASIETHLKPLKDLRARYGVFYVTGNHEYYWGAEPLVGKIKELGFTALLNDHRILGVGHGKLLVGGITDPEGADLVPGHDPDLRKALSTDEHVDFKILLSHRPDPFAEAEKLGAGLQFSGHTHAGQFFPFSLLIPLAHSYYRGLNRHGGLWIYVNPGTGYWGPANRFGITSEITLLTLARA